MAKKSAKTRARDLIRKRVAQEEKLYEHAFIARDNFDNSALELITAINEITDSTRHSRSGVEKDLELSPAHVALLRAIRKQIEANNEEEKAEEVSPPEEHAEENSNDEQSDGHEDTPTGDGHDSF